MGVLLPFKTSPKPVETVLVGDDTTGVLEIKKYNDLTPNEKIFIREHTKQLPDITFEAAVLSTKIVDQTGMTLTEAYQAITTGDTEKLTGFLPELAELNSKIDYNNEYRPLVYVTAILKYRVNPEFTIDDLKQIHPKLITSIYEFAMNEQMGWEKNVEEEEKKEQPVTEESLKKS